MDDSINWGKRGGVCIHVVCGKFLGERGTLARENGNQYFGGRQRLAFSFFLLLSIDGFIVYDNVICA